ncbi:autotransporter outer membrane beta-barrel domain-containing protein [Mesorhizobium sp. M00.F.Ca.ET.151.01.1.1]|nr:autotransporter outer membrane beta-barrel domain-containing protein [Mesorhizobium sp. M00.F.Ca.ET.151.01.1.1]
MKANGGALRRIWDGTLLAGVNGAAVACLFPGMASAAQYDVASLGELNNALATITSTGDPTPVIVLRADITTSINVLTSTSPLTIDTNGYTLTAPQFSGGQAVIVTGTGNVVGLSNVAGLVVNNGANVTNEVSVEGASFSTPGTTGQIGASVMNNSTLANSGSIVGGNGTTAGGPGVQVSSGGQLTNNAGGTIQGGSGSQGLGGIGVAIGSPAGAQTKLTNNGTILGGEGTTGGGIGVVVRTNNVGTITNTGKVQGGTGAAAIMTNSVGGSLSIVNSGSISGGAGANAISLIAGSTGSLKLELQAGSVIVGNVVGGNGANDVFTVGGDTAAVLDGMIGAAGQYRNFDILEKTGASTWALTADNTATQAWTISQGTLQIGNGGTTGSILGNVTDNGTLAFDRSDTYTYAGVISGSGAVSQIGTGTTVLTGANTYSGGTTISAGTLSVSADNNLGDASGGLTFNGGVLQVTGTAFTGTDRTITLGLLGGGFDIADAGNAFTASQAITGSGALTKLGAGTLILTGDSNYGGGTTISAGTLQLGNGGTSGSITGNVANNGTLAFDRSDTYTFAGTISGNGAAIQQGSGTTILTADSNYTGGTTISAGTLQLGNGGLSGSITGNVNNNGTLVFDRSNGLVLAGVISGSGGVIQQGSSTTALTGDNTYNGGTTISAGTLQLGNRGTSGSITGDVTNNGTLAFYRTDSYTFAGTISGSGAVNQLGSGTTILTADNTYAGVTTISAGTLQLGNGGTSGSIAGNVIDNGTLAFDRSDAVTFAGVISGSGAVSQIGTGTTILTADNTYAGVTTIAAGTLQLGNGGTSGSIAGNVTNNGTLIIDRSNGVTLAGAISGSGSVVQQGAGSTTLAGTNSYGGGTTISAGTLIGQATSFGTGNILNDAALVFDQPANATFASIIEGSGTLTKRGAGNLDLTGINTLNGATTIEAGKLSVNGSLANSAVTILGGGALGGNGTVGSTTLQAGGVIAPGNSIGLLTIQGNFVGAGGTVEIEAILDGDASSTDKLVITGNTSGTANVKVIGLGGGGAQTVDGIKIIDVGGTSAGTFNLLGDYVFQGDQAVVAGAYAYRMYQNGISTPADGDWYLRSALINPVDPGGPTSPLYAPSVPVYEAYAGVLQSFNQLGTLQQRAGNRSWTGAAQPDADDRVEGGSPIWGRIEAAHKKFDPGTSTTGTDYDADLWRVQAGLDGQLAQMASGVLIGGVTVHYGTVKSDISSAFGLGSIDTTGYGFGGTLTWYGNSGFYVDAQAELTWFDSDLSSATLGKRLVKGNNGFGYGLGIEAGQKIGLQGNWSLTPQAQLSYSSVDFDSFTDPYGAVVANGGSDSLIGRLGLSADYESRWKDKTGKTSRSHVYGIGNLYYDFLDGSDVDVSGTVFSSKSRQLSGGLGLGGSLSWADDRYSVNGEVLARTSLEDFGDSRSIGGTVGFKVKW